VLSDRSLLLGGDGLPVLRGQPSSLDGGLLAEGVIAAVCAYDLEQKEERLRVGVIVLLELGGNGLEPLRVGCS